MTCFLEFLLFVPYVSRVSSENPSWKSTSTACTMEKGPYHQGAEMTGLGILSPVVFAWIFHSPSGKAIWKLQQQKFTWLADFNCWFLVGGEDEDTMTLLKTAAIGYLTSNRTCRNLTTSSHPEENVQRKICGTGINGKAHFLQKKLFKLSAWIWGFAWLTWNWFSMWLLFVLVPDKLSSKVFNGTLMATQPAFAWSVFFTTGHTLLQTGFQTLCRLEIANATANFHSSAPFREGILSERCYIQSWVTIANILKCHLANFNFCFSVWWLVSALVIFKIQQLLLWCVHHVYPWKIARPQGPESDAFGSRSLLSRDLLGHV